MKSVNFQRLISLSALLCIVIGLSSCSVAYQIEKARAKPYGRDTETRTTDKVAESKDIINLTVEKGILKASLQTGVYHYTEGRWIEHLHFDNYVVGGCIWGIPATVTALALLIPTKNDSHILNLDGDPYNLSSNEIGLATGLLSSVVVDGIITAQFESRDKTPSKNKQYWYDRKTPWQLSSPTLVKVKPNHVPNYPISISLPAYNWQKRYMTNSEGTVKAPVADFMAGFPKPQSILSATRIDISASTTIANKTIHQIIRLGSVVANGQKPTIFSCNIILAQTNENGKTGKRENEKFLIASLWAPLFWMIPHVYQFSENLVILLM